MLVWRIHVCVGTITRGQVLLHINPENIVINTFISSLFWTVFKTGKAQLDHGSRSSRCRQYLQNCISTNKKDFWNNALQTDKTKVELCVLKRPALFLAKTKAFHHKHLVLMDEDRTAVEEWWFSSYSLLHISVTLIKLYRKHLFQIPVAQGGSTDISIMRVISIGPCIYLILRPKSSNLRDIFHIYF